MDATQAIDWGIGDEAADDHQADAVEVGSLSVSHPDGTAELHRLYTGQNIVARRGSERHKDDERLERWREQYSGRDKMNGIFLESSSISSPHAMIFLENGGELCFVKDLSSKNRTILEIPGKRRQVLEPGDRWSVSGGDTLIFGNARCQVDIHPAAARADQGPSLGIPAEGQRAGTFNQAETQAYMSFGEASEEGGGLAGEEGGPAAAAASNSAAAAAAAAGGEAAGRSEAVAQQVRRPSRPQAAPRPPSKPPAPTIDPHRRPPSDRSPAEAWSAFQDGPAAASSAASSAQRSHSAFVPPVSLSDGVPAPARPADKGRSLDSLSPFSAFAGAAVPAEEPSQVWPERRTPAFPPSLFDAPDQAASTHERQSSMQRAGSIQKVSSLHDWAAFRRSSAERLPSLQDWIMPSLGSSPMSQRGSMTLHPLAEAPIPEASVPPETALGSMLFCSEALPQPKLALSRPKGIPPGRHPGANFFRANFGNESSADEVTGSLEGASPSLSSWKLRAPRSPGRPVTDRGAPGRFRNDGARPPAFTDSSEPRGGGRASSASPKRGRTSMDEGIFVGSFDDEAQPQKSPRLNRRPVEGVASGAPPAARTGSPSRSNQDSGPGFADFHAVMDSLWGNKGVHPESTPVG
ncbi:hypothetical protein COCOBI_01-0340 [Coccomyxa sp. Obi]|nr:hypothetical protein COCOBI_01-0340 [Coccomyxa sp. Obi]